MLIVSIGCKAVTNGSSIFNNKKHANQMHRESLMIWVCDSPLLMGALHVPAVRLLLKRSALPR